MYIKNDKLITDDNAEEYISMMKGKDGLQDIKADSL